MKYWDRKKIKQVKSLKDENDQALLEKLKKAILSEPILKRQD